MSLEIFISNFEIIVFFSIILIVLGMISLIFIYKNDASNNKLTINKSVKILDNSNKDIKDYLISIGNILDQQKNEILKITDKISFIEKEISRLGSIKGSEDILGLAIDMARKGEDKESIKNKTNLRDDEIEAIYTYYRK